MLRNRKGFTLIETLVATMILAIGVVTILQLFSGGLNAVKTSEDYTRAVFHAREKMNEILVADKLAQGVAEGVFDDGFQWRVEISKIEPDGDKITLPVHQFSVHVTVQWQKGTRMKTMAIDTITIATEIKEEG